ncbi:hypothetical protein ACFVU4_32480 [Streptomyces sp. NPDC058107]|uniref:hypothetical protein n=1 Tax=Streptomyces sp. NPDC058107 TaxID=3346343 RepID=UPI0036E3E6C8
MASKLPAGAERLGNDAKLKVRKAAKKVAKAVDVLMGTAPAPRTARLGDRGGGAARPARRRPGGHRRCGADGRRRRRRGVAARAGRPHSTVRGFIELLVDAVDFGAVEAWAEAAAECSSSCPP